MSLENIAILVLEEIFLLWSYYFISAHITHTDVNGSYTYMLTVKCNMCSNPSFCLIVLMLCALSISEHKKKYQCTYYFLINDSLKKFYIVYCDKRHGNVIKNVFVIYGNVSFGLNLRIGS